MNKIYLSVILPSYNETKNINRGVLTQVHDYLAKQKYSWEVIISDDGSTDQSADLVADQISAWPRFRLLRNVHGGKPSALLHGIQAAKGEYVLFTDMDQSTPITQLAKLLKKLTPGTKVVIGSRGLERKNFPFYRKLGSAVFVTLRKLFLLRDIKDTQCGFKLFDRKLVAKAFPKLEFFKKNTRVTGWQVTSYDVELLHIIKKMGERIEEVVVNWSDADESDSKGGGVGRYLRESQEMIVQIMRVKRNDLRGIYD